MPRILGIGDNTVDVYVTDGMQYPGGNAVNVAVQARRAGAEASYLGCLGRDALGELLHGALVAEGIDISHLRWRDGPNARSPIAHKDGDRIFLGGTPGVRGLYDLAAADEAFIAAHDLAHTSVHSDLDAELPRIRRHAPLLAYDYSEHWTRPGKAETLRHVDIAFLSSPLADQAECEAIMRLCAAQGPSLVVLTRGMRGSMALWQGTVSTAGTRPAEVVDTLGAGDAFIGAFLVNWLQRRDPRAALEAGAAHAALACSIKGAFGHGVPTPAEAAGS
jgi:fructoselysine 6-kinase